MKTTNKFRGFKFWAIVTAASITFLFPSYVSAQVPRLITYQGILKDANNAYLSGTYPMTFRLYDAETAGASLWQETQSAVSVSSGRFSVQLGNVSPLNLGFSQDYWLSVQVGADTEMAPRQRMTSVGYAYMAEQVVNGFNQVQHDALSHRNIEGVKANAENIAKTNFKLDSYTKAAANSMGDMIVDTFNDATGIDAAGSTNYTWRGSPHYDVVVTPSGGGVIQQALPEDSATTILESASAASYNGLGEKFQHTATTSVDRIAFKWARWRDPTGNVRVRIYSDNGGVPGTLLGESANISVPGIASIYPSFEEFTATLITPVTIQANTFYHAVIENVDAVGNNQNHVYVRSAANNNPYPQGHPVSKNSSGSWVALGDGYDTYFKVYEAPNPSGSAEVKSISFSESVAPKEALLVADETLNKGGITYYVSRDNGTTWTACPKDTVVSINAQPVGKQIRWRAVITGDAELNALAVGL